MMREEKTTILGPVGTKLDVATSRPSVLKSVPNEPSLEEVT